LMRSSARNNDWTRILGWPVYRVYRSEINEEAKTSRLWVRRKSGERKLVCSRSIWRSRRHSFVPALKRRTKQALCRSQKRNSGLRTQMAIQQPKTASRLAPLALLWQDSREMLRLHQIEDSLCTGVVNALGIAAAQCA
jgi:hypothetical protein